MSTPTESRSTTECAHGAVWRAPDGVWRCEACEPPHFPAEIVERRSEQELLSLFDAEEKTWVSREEWDGVSIDAA